MAETGNRDAVLVEPRELPVFCPNPRMPLWSSHPRVYLDNTPWGCISCAYGWQAAVGTLGQLRSIGHALRAWPTPLGVAINSADEIWDGAGLLTDTGVQGQLDLLATQLVTFARAAWETA